MKEWLQLQSTRLDTAWAFWTRTWKDIPIKECGEPLVQVPEEMAFPYYAREMGLGRPEEPMYLRDGVMECLENARKRLAHIGLDLVVYDGWRSIERQETLFWHYMKEFAAPKLKMGDQFAQCENGIQIKAHCERLPRETQNALYKENTQYVSFPSRDPRTPPPHATGGAADVWLHAKGEQVELGTPFDHLQKEVGTFYHLRLFRRRFARERAVYFNRTQLTLAMTRAGFSCHPREFWHYNRGNQMDACVKGGVAFYGYIEP